MHLLVNKCQHEALLAHDHFSLQETWEKQWTKVFLFYHNRRPTTLQDRTRDSDDDDYQDRDYDVAALANNLSQAFRYDIYNNEGIDEVWIHL